MTLNYVEQGLQFKFFMDDQKLFLWMDQHLSI